MCNRRQFLVRTMWLALLSTTARTVATEGVPSGTADLTPADLETLAAAMDEIIPRSDDMPSASMAGGLDYLQHLAWQYPDIQEKVGRFLDAVTQVSVAHFTSEFRKLPHNQRLQVLTAVERTHGSAFSAFVGYVYESYYTNPKVLGLISCWPSTRSTEDDETLLQPVRKLKHLYREVR